MQRRRKNGKEQINLILSLANVQDLIVPFLYQTKVLKPSDEVERFTIDLCAWENEGDPMHYSVWIDLKKEGGVEDNTQLREGEQVGGHTIPSSSKRSSEPSKAKSNAKGSRSQR